WRVPDRAWTQGPVSSWRLASIGTATAVPWCSQVPPRARHHPGAAGHPPRGSDCFRFRFPTRGTLLGAFLAILAPAAATGAALFAGAATTLLLWSRSSHWSPCSLTMPPSERRQGHSSLCRCKETEVHRCGVVALLAPHRLRLGRSNRAGTRPSFRKERCGKRAADNFVTPTGGGRCRESQLT